MDAARLFPVLFALLLSLRVGVSEGIDSDWSRGRLGLLLPDEASELVRLERRIPLLLLCRLRPDGTLHRWLQDSLASVPLR